MAGADVVILSLFTARNRLGEAAPFREGDLAFLNKIIAAKPGAVMAMTYGNPHLIRKIPGVGPRTEVRVTAFEAVGARG